MVPTLGPRRAAVLREEPPRSQPISRETHIGSSPGPQETLAAALGRSGSQGSATIKRLPANLANAGSEFS